MAVLAWLFSSVKLCIANNTFRLDTMCSMINLSKIAKITSHQNLILNIYVKMLNFTFAKISTYTVFLGTEKEGVAIIRSDITC